jgi:6,7-dimethyl-8-ribityllumazine synthase
MTQPEFRPIEAGADGAGLRVGIVASRFNEEICARVLALAQAELARLGVRAADVTIARVAGALEIPLALQWMAQSEKFDALVAIGAVIRGETYHFELVANESARGLMDVALEFGIPVSNGILTTDDEAQALARADKGAEAVRVAVEMARLGSAFRRRFSERGA